ncbi:hypothetical protein E4T56_gene7292 [Termitomyces sp. T112]|nr:hypothetical protein E4T56_gene7292 [Termitomyces sp. T112]KNZ82024.1 hypothetical protein J132_08369 [Termitomyces sp. J132]
MTNYGMAYFLEDKSGMLTGSEFVDLNDRIRLSYICTARDTNQTVYMIYDATTVDSSSRPLLALTFGPNNALGTVHISPDDSMPMRQYLKKASTLGSTKHRKFVASDGHEYRWNWRVEGDQEWTCTNTLGYIVAYYNLKTPGEPEYADSSGCMLTVEQPYHELIPGESSVELRYKTAYVDVLT